MITQKIQSLQKKIKGFVYRNDKLVHWLTCIVIGLVVLFITANIYLTITAIVVAGVGKELYDKYIKKTFFDWWDIAVDLAAIPIVIAVWLIWF